MKFDTEIQVRNLRGTNAIAKKFARELLRHGGGVVLFRAEMGAGKTTFTRLVVKYLDRAAVVQSPTFTIINKYTENIYHADLYRITDENELLNTEIFDIMNLGTNYVFIEWSERAAMPKCDYLVEIRHGNDENNTESRIFRISKQGDKNGKSE